MPSQQEVKWSQLKVGVIVIVSMLLLTTLLFLMTKSSGMSPFTKKLVVRSYFTNSNGLKQGGEVLLEGVTIGEVRHVRIVNDPARKLTPVEVEMKIDPRFAPDLHKDSKAALAKEGLVGDTTIDINSRGAYGPQLENGDELPTSQSADLDSVLDTSKTTLDSLNVTLGRLDKIVQGIQQGQGTVGQLVTNRELFDRLDASLTELNTLLRNVNSGKGSAGKLLNDDTLYNKLNDTATKLDNIASGLDNGKGSAGKLLKDDTLYNNLNQTLGHANSLLAEADAGKGALGLLAKDPAFAKKLDNTVSNLDSMLNNVNQGKGTLGKLATDDQAYNNLNKLLTESTTLVSTIRQDPKKYLTIHLKIF